MDSARWQKVQSIFHEVADLPETTQQARLRARCGDDQALVAEVMALLREDASGVSLLDRDVAHIAHEILLNEEETLPFKQLGPYRLKRALGHGGMGVVYLAEREDLATRVAIKVLRDAWLSPARRERFAIEQRTLAQLNHPSIARLYDADATPDGTPFFVMEYVEGVPLVEYCVAHQSSIEGRLRLLRSVCEAVIYAHQHAVIHRDLKPSNIFVKEDGTVRLLDFGIAKHLETLGSPLQQTMTGLRLMTPAYASPEQIRGEQVGIQTDVYSLGVILYELLSSRLPFDFSERTPVQAEKIVTQQDAERPSAVAEKTAARSDTTTPAPEVSKSAWEELDVLCLTALHKDTQQRYASVEALLRDIDHFLKKEPLEARPDTTSYRIGKFVMRNRAKVITAATSFAIFAGLVIFFTVRLARARNTALAEAARTQRIQGFMLNLFKGGDDAAGPSDELRVVALLDRGVSQAQSLNAEPAVQAELYQTLGNIYQQLGKFDQADGLLRSALDQRTQLFGSDSREAAESMAALGLLRSSEARLDEAEQLVRQGLDISKRKLPREHPAVAKATFAVGKVLEGRGRYDQAIAMLDEAVRMQSTRDGKPTTDLAASLSELANSHFYLGHYDISEYLNERVLMMQRQLYGERHPLVADTLINLGAIQFQKGNYKESERFNRQALDIVQAWYGKVHPETADTMTILGQSLTYQQRFDESADLLRQSLSILERVYGPMHPRVAFALNELGNVAIRQAKLEEAEADFSRVVNIYRTVYGDKHYQIGIAESNLAGVYMERKEYARAERLFREALQIYGATLPPDHLSVGISRARLGSTLAAEHRYSEAEVESLAGYEILSKKAGPSIKWLQTARHDLATEYQALKQPDKAVKFREPIAKP
jgi:serine/threonine protein kinase/tetratricopeptide (TPR) repeat protein